MINGRKFISQCIFLFITLLTYKTFANQNELKLEGTIGKFPIEIIISNNNWEEGTFEGKYHYKNKKESLSIKGEIFSPCVEIEEFYNEENTGTFYLERIGDNFSGKWVSDATSYDVSLSIKSGDKNLLSAKSLKDYAEKTSKSFSGTYESELYYINDYFFEKNNPQIEIASNGGSVVIKELSQDSINFQVMVVCGPTYHIAYAEGIAIKKDSIYEYREALSEDEDECVIKITFGDRSVKMEADVSFVCMFGARAYLNHEFIKVDDKAEFKDY